MSESTVEYTLSGVLHYLQAEWRNFEREKNEWLIEKAELQARISMLEGERKGIENLKINLMKRVKMLEYVLKQERNQLPGVTIKDPLFKMETKINPIIPLTDNKMKEKSRDKLKSCLQEINQLTSSPTKLPLTNALATRSSSVRTVPLPAYQPSSPIPKQNSIKENVIPLPVKVEDKEENASPDNLSKQLQEKFNLSEEKIRKIIKNTNKTGQHKLNDDRSSVGDFDPNQINDLDIQQGQPRIWKPRITVKGHLDSVRSVCFHPTEMIAASGSDDGTVKIWNLQRVTGKDGNTNNKKGSLEEADPSITFRGHHHVVTAVAINDLQNRVYSSSLDSTIRVWKLPLKNRGPFSPVDSSLNIATYVGHTDAIWDFKLSPSKQYQLLASVSADRTIKIWDTNSRENFFKSSFTFDGLEKPNRIQAVPTSVDFYKKDPTKLIVSFANAKVKLYDIETGKVITTIENSDDSYDGTIATQINRIVSHPTMSIVVSGHEDQHIKYFDINSGKCIQTVSGHLDSVTSLDINSSGTTMISGGHDSSIRLWDLSSKVCTQEFSAHRRKGDEGVLSVSFHRTYPWLISGGADSIVKIYNDGY